MNWITRCPACSCVYKVVPDQLQVASGWLRCGQCQHAFDSTGLVLPWSDDPAAASANAVVHESDQRVVIDELLRQEDRSKAAPVALGSPVRPQTDTMYELTAFSEALSSFRPPDSKASGEAACSSDPVLHADPMSPSLEDPDTVDSGTARSTTAARGRLQLLVVLALLLLLALQGGWSQRHALATFFPTTGPVLRQMCDWMGCNILPWRQPDGIVIDSSDFVRQADGFVLQWTVRNTTALTLGMTSLELKLQDTQDKPLVRRVFDPAQWGAPATLSPGQSWSGQLFIQVDAALPVTGYRLLSFYP